MAAETQPKPTDAEKLNKTFIEARIEEYKKRRKGGLWSSSALKNTGFLAAVAGTVAYYSSAALSPGLAAAEVVRILAKVAFKVGAGVAIFGAIKELYNERKRP